MAWDTDNRRLVPYEEWGYIEYHPHATDEDDEWKLGWVVIKTRIDEATLIHTESLVSKETYVVLSIPMEELDDPLDSKERERVGVHGAKSLEFQTEVRGYLDVDRE